MSDLSSDVRRRHEKWDDGHAFLTAIFPMACAVVRQCSWMLPISFMGGGGGGGNLFTNPRTCY